LLNNKQHVHGIFIDLSKAFVERCSTHATRRAFCFSPANSNSKLRLRVLRDGHRPSSKDFDAIDHGKLISKLNHYSIHGYALKLISSYLYKRKQYLSVLKEKSDELLVEYGVPQGSVLGPLLFILYIIDICNISDKGQFVLFADDTNIFLASDSKEKVFITANQVLQDVST
jgi:hypothetical protein